MSKSMESETMPSYALVTSEDLNSCPIQNLPLEIIAKIARNLSTSDILQLASVNKTWRCEFLNQNYIWKRICQRLNLDEDDYINCLTDVSRSSSYCKGYVELNSDILFGPYCKWWTVYSRYNMIIKNIKENNFPTFHIPRKAVYQSYCTDDYIINVYRSNRKYPIEAIILKGYELPMNKIQIQPFDVFEEILQEDNSLNIVGNKRFLVFEVHSVIFVYFIRNGEFIFGYSKVIHKSPSSCPSSLTSSSTTPNCSNLYKSVISEPNFLMVTWGTKIDICGDKLALVQPHGNTIFQIDLIDGTINHELIYNNNEARRCFVDCIKCATDRLMIGLTIQEENKIIYEAVVYHLDKNSDYSKFIVPLFDCITQFKVAKNLIGIENNSPTTPFVIKVKDFITVFWIDCDSFSFDFTRNFIYYNVNQSIFQYDLTKSRSDKFEVIEKIASDAVSNLFSLTAINDRFLLVRSVLPNSYNIFDVIDHVPVRSMQLKSGFSLTHVGRKTIVFSNSKEFVINSFC